MGSQFKKIKSLLLVVSILVSQAVWASPEVDRVYQLDTLAWLKAADNVDGIFADYLDEIYSDYFKKQSRFEIKKLSGLEQVLGRSSMPYIELVQTPDLIKKISQKFKVENFLRTRVYKESDTYRFVLDWVYAPRGDVLSSFEFRYIDPKKDGGLENSDLPDAVRAGLTTLIEKLPFLGQVTGVEGQTVTLNIGRNQNIQPRDTVSLATLQSVRRHPMLNRIEEWRFVNTGRAEVEQVEESMSFARVIEVEDGQSIHRFQKIKSITPAPIEVEHTEIKTPRADDKPRVGWIAGNIMPGSYSREVGLTGGTSGVTGSGFLTNFEVDSQFWLDSRWLLQGSIMAGIHRYSPKDLSTGNDLGVNFNGSSNRVRAAVGYTLFPTRTVFDSMAWVNLGVKHTSYSLPIDAAKQTGSSSFTSMIIGIGGQIPFQKNFQGQIGLDLGLFRGASQKSPNFGDSSASSDVSLNLGVAYRLDERFMARILFKLDSQTMDFPAGETVSQKMFSIGPSIMYYF